MENKKTKDLSKESKELCSRIADSRGVLYHKEHASSRPSCYESAFMMGLQLREKILKMVSERIGELKDIRERERSQGITSKDEYIIEGSISELELFAERIKHEI